MFFVNFQYVVLYTSESCDPVNKVYYLDLTTLPNGLEGFRGGKDLLPFTRLIDSFDAAYGVVANDGTVFTFRTNRDAPRYKLVRVDLKAPDIWTDIIPQSEKNVLESAFAVNGNHLLVCYLSDVKHVLEVRDLEHGSLLHHLPLDIGSVDDISARRKDSVVFFRFTSFLSPGIIYQCDLKSNVPDLKIFRETVVPKFDRDEFHVNQVFVFNPMIFVLWNYLYIMFGFGEMGEKKGRKWRDGIFLIRILKEEGDGEKGIGSILKFSFLIFVPHLKISQ